METRSRMSRSLHTNRDFEKLEPYEGKPSRTVLRGEEGSNALDLPDRPSDLAQRDGRAVRKGNEIAKLYADNRVDVIIYAVENRWTRTSSTCCTASRRSSRSSKAGRWERVPSTRGLWTRSRA